MQSIEQKEKKISLYFRISIFIKGLLSIIEIIGGILALLVPISYVTFWMIRLAQGELVSDAPDFVAILLIKYAHQLSVAGRFFIAVYLLSRGAVKLVLVGALYKNKLWAYPASLIVLGLFLVYQLYHIITSFSPLLTILTIFDLFVMWTIWAEYKTVRAHLLSWPPNQ